MAWQSTREHTSNTRKCKTVGKGVIAYQSACRAHSNRKFRTEIPQGSLRSDVTQHASVHVWLDKHDKALARGFGQLAEYFMVKALEAARALA